MNDTHFETPEEAKVEIFMYIETYYNVKRMQWALGYMSSAEFEKCYLSNLILCLLL